MKIQLLAVGLLASTLFASCRDGGNQYNCECVTKGDGTTETITHTSEEMQRSEATDWCSSYEGIYMEGGESFESICELKR